MAEITGRRTLHEGFHHIVGLTVRDPAAPEREWEVDAAAETAAVLPYDPAARTALLVRVLRPGALLAGEDGWSLEAPAGYVDDGETGEEAARREALEEVGVRLAALQPLGRAYPSPGRSAERMHLFLAEYAATDRIADGGGIDEEGVQVVAMPLTDLARAADEGRLLSLPTLFLITALRGARPDLFA